MVATLLLSSCQTHFVGGWLPWFQTSANRATELSTIGAASVLFNEVSLFWYGARADGTITPNGNVAALDPTAAAVRAQGLLVIPTVVDGNGPGVMRAILLDPTQRASHEDKIVALVNSKNYDGVDLDYETFAFGDHLSPTSDPAAKAAWAAAKAAWIAFVTELAAKLHNNATPNPAPKLLSVTVPATWKLLGITLGYPFYSQQEIGAVVDRLRLMVYDWSVGSPGPIAPMSWDNMVIDYSTKVAGVPPSKLQLGVPAYGRHWATQLRPSEVCPDGAVRRESLTMKAAPALAAAHGAPIVRDVSGELTFTWDQVVTGPRTTPIPPPIVPIVGQPAPMVDAAGDSSGLQPAQRLAPPSTFVTCTVRHIAFYPDAASVKQRADAAMLAGWHGIFIWALGYETTDTYQQLANVGP